MGYISVVKHYRVPDHEGSVDITIMDEKYAYKATHPVHHWSPEGCNTITNSQPEFLKKGKERTCVA